MTVQQLLDLLEDLVDEGLEDAEVRLATQPSYPLQAMLAGIALSSDLGRDEEDEDLDDEEGVVVFLLEGSQPSDTPYASRRLWDANRY